MSITDGPVNGTALVLSGGGFRATLFHIGSLIRLNELGLLEGIDCISGVSGGSIITAMLGMNWHNLRFDNGVAGNLEEVVLTSVRKLCMRDLDTPVTLENALNMLFNLPSQGLQKLLAKHLLGDATLRDLPAPGQGPRIVITASNLETGNLVVFSREAISEPLLGEAQVPELKLAEVVAASAAYPPFLSPVVIRTDPDSWVSTTGIPVHQRLRLRMVLTDGGIHDPMGIEPVWHKYKTLLVSDASHTQAHWQIPVSDWFRQSNRVILLQTITNSLARRDLLVNAVFKPLNGLSHRDGAYWNNIDELDDCGFDNANEWDNSVEDDLCQMRTRLSTFNKREQGWLINWGYVQCESALRRYMGLGDPMGQWPEPEYSLNEVDHKDRKA